MIADLHCHPTVNPYNCKGTIWDHEPPTLSQRNNIINTLVFSRFTQGDFKSIGKGNVRLVFASIYPIEWHFLSQLFSGPRPSKTIRQIIKEGLNLLTHNHPEEFLARVIFDMPADQLDKLTSSDHEYFQSFLDEYQFLINSIQQPGDTYTIRIVSSFSELNNLLQFDNNLNPQPTQQNIIAIVLTIEGMHTLGSGQHNTTPPEGTDELALLNDLTNPWTNNLLTKLSTNLARLKALDGGKHTPFFATFSHHFWNQLCGHSMSLANIMNKVFSQTQYMNTGFTKVGEKIVEQMLSTANGQRRILIDIKHMSVAGRKWYYQYLKDNYPSQTIPIIASHMGVNGRATITENNSDHHTMDEAYEKAEGNFNIWDINLADDEIITIHQSRGLIGINMDQRILSSKKMVDNLTSLSTQFIRRGIKADSPLYRSLWAEPILTTCLHIVSTIYKAYPNDTNEQKKAWELVCIGSDFDGMINALDAYCNSMDFNTLKTMLTLKMKMRQAYEPCLQNQNIDALVDGIMYKNTLRFLQRNFN